MTATGDNEDSTWVGRPLVRGDGVDPQRVYMVLVAGDGQTAEVAKTAGPFGDGYYFNGCLNKTNAKSRRRGGYVVPAHIRIAKPRYFASEQAYFDQAGVQGFTGEKEKRALYNAALRAEGYDGLVVTRALLSGASQEFVVFELEQIFPLIGDGQSAEAAGEVPGMRAADSEDPVQDLAEKARALIAKRATRLKPSVLKREYAKQTAGESEGD